MKVITLLTDFGYEDTYVAQMKGVILNIAGDVKIVDLSHALSRHNIEEGAFLLYTSIPYFPRGSIHVAVVDPGVGTERRGILVRTEDYYLVGPDNGLLIPAAKRCKDFDVFEITNESLLLPLITHTFHARDVFAPVAAHLANGIPPEGIGKKIQDFVDFDIEFGRVEDGKILGKVIHIDRFGNIITNVEGNLIVRHAKYGDVLHVEIGKKRLSLPFLKTYGYAEKGKPLVTIGGNGYVEISINQGNASEKFGAKAGMEIILSL